MESRSTISAVIEQTGVQFTYCTDLDDIYLAAIKKETANKLEPLKAKIHFNQIYVHAVSSAEAMQITNSQTPPQLDGSKLQTKKNSKLLLTSPSVSSENWKQMSQALTGHVKMHS